MHFLGLALCLAPHVFNIDQLLYQMGMMDGILGESDLLTCIYILALLNSVSATETMVQDFQEFGQVPKWDIRASAVLDFENMTDLEHMLLPFMYFSHKHD